MRPAPAPAASPAARVRAPFLLVTGGKGGVGKTILSANLALELARRGRRVLLVDLDLGLADVAVLLRLAPAREIEDALAGRCTLAECVVRGPCGLDVLPAGAGTVAMGRLEPAQRDDLLRGLAALAAGYDLVLGDGAAGIGPDALAFAAAADHVLLVTTPDAAALADAYGLIKALHSVGEAGGREVATPELVVNQTSGLEEAERTAAKLRSVCERFLSRSPQSAGWLPASAEVARSARTQSPFVLDARAGLAHGCLKALAGRVERLVPLRARAPLAGASRAGARPLKGS